MLRIRREQMDAFAGHMAEQFERKLVARLRSLFPDKTRDVTDSALRESIRAGGEVAAAYGVAAERDVARFVLLQHQLAPDFDISPSYPWARETLVRTNLTGTEKMDALEQQAGQTTSQPRR